MLARKKVSIGCFKGESVSISEAIENAAKFMSESDTPQATELLDGFLALTDSVIKIIESADTSQPKGNSTRNMYILIYKHCLHYIITKTLNYFVKGSQNGAEQQNEVVLVMLFCVCTICNDHA